jgi:hypothetical protein
VESVIALLYTISTHQHHIYLLILFSLHIIQICPSSSLPQLFTKAYIFFLFMHDTSTREVIPSPFNAGIFLVKQQRSKWGENYL